MARKTARPGRTLVVFFLVMAIAYGLVALAGTWKPTLGLDLQGGTSITLRAEGDPGEEALDQARQIIDDRVNGSGVAEAEVTTQGGNEIVVEIPGENARNLIETVQRTAQLRFRLVACSTVDGRCATTTGLPEGIQIDPSTTLPQDESQDGGQDGGQDGDQSQGGNNRAALGAWARLSDTQGDGADGADGSGGSGGQGDENSNGNRNRNRNGNGQQSPYDACIAAAADDETTAEPLSWIDNPTTACVDAFSQFQASGGCQQGATSVMGDDPATPLITCDEDGIAYLLSPAMIEGTQLDDAGAAIPQQQVNYVVTLSFDGDGTEVFADISNALVGTEKQFAIVLDGQVLSAPTMEGRILDGNAQISGDFNETTANSLATSLRYGSLPIAFEDQPLVETIGPSLAGDQLSAGLTAGGIGLAIVMLYCLLYYRGLGTVVIASLFVAAGITYAMVLLLSETANFTLTLPGIAGIIVAVGITADSFIVYFERIRDEMRIGKSMKVAVEAGWKRARNTCLAADAVSLLAAVVLYIFAAGVVKGFAFALGLTTIIDLVVFFWFTHPMVSWLAKYRFFNKGHRLSGLSPETLGVARTATGGNA
ncbi:protein translocase subunit SecD [uncultured Nocardioides sp.]|uniref:protein translocase subunit SecD n=1 Tax=uncultured Nocardioides sp. TaxID=198441 RepID=UPI0026216066|nr:protein translocase subunit SecD [uncultured Nocardioides sp.]